MRIFLLLSVIVVLMFGFSCRKPKVEPPPPAVEQAESATEPVMEPSLPAVDEQDFESVGTPDLTSEDDDEEWEPLDEDEKAVE